MIVKNPDIPSFWEEYNVNKNFTWNYFEGQVPDNRKYSAFITTEIESSYAVRSLNETKCTFSFIKEYSNTIPYVNKKNSWVINNEKSDSLLIHEEGHAKIAHIYAQKLKNKLKTLDLEVFSCSGNDLSGREQSIKNNSQLIVAKIANEIYTMRNFTDLDYDHETDHNKKSIQQERWNHIIGILVNNPAQDLANVKLLVPEAPHFTTYSVQPRSCEFFDLSDYCTPTFTELLLNIVIGLVVGACISAYFYKREQRDREKIDIIIEGLEKTKNKRYKYIMSSFDEYLPDIRVLCESRNEKIMFLLKNNDDDATKKLLDANLKFLELDVKHLQFLLNTQTDVLFPVQIERFKIVIDLLNVIIANNEQNSTHGVQIKSLFAEIEKLEEVTTKVIGWRDLPT